MIFNDFHCPQELSNLDLGSPSSIFLLKFLKEAILVYDSFFFFLKFGAPASPKWFSMILIDFPKIFIDFPMIFHDFEWFLNDFLMIFNDFFMVQWFSHDFQWFSMPPGPLKSRSGQVELEKMIFKIKS